MTTQQAALDQITSLHTRLDFGDNAPDLAGEELARCYPEQVQVLRVAGMLDAAWLLAPRTPPIPPKAEHQVVNPKALPERGVTWHRRKKIFGAKGIWTKSWTRRSHSTQG